MLDLVGGFLLAQERSGTWNFNMDTYMCVLCQGEIIFRTLSCTVTVGHGATA